MISPKHERNMRLGVVSPCYNEEEVLPSSVEKLTELFRTLISKDKISAESFVLFVNDGSRDRTWEIISQSHKENPFVKGLCLAHNVGHQNAILAGMMVAKDMCDAVITIDADLQDDINAIEQMVDLFSEGTDIVYGMKVSRQADPIMKRISAEAFYKLQKKMGVDSVFNHADFRLMSKRALEALSQYPERNIYLRGIIPSLGFNTAMVDDVISERTAGKSKYSLKKMLGLAVDGITSFSTKPMYVISYIGLAFMVIGIFIALDVLISMIRGNNVPGWASMLLSIWIVGGMCLMAIGVLGVYIGKIYVEAKQRPRYIIKEFLND